MRITLYDFLALPDQEQYYIVFNAGGFLDYRIEENSKFALYAIDLFFVEVEYDSENNKIVDKQAFVQGEILDKFSGLKI